MRASRVRISAEVEFFKSVYSKVLEFVLIFESACDFIISNLQVITFGFSGMYCRARYNSLHRASTANFGRSPSPTRHVEAHVQDGPK